MSPKWRGITLRQSAVNHKIPEGYICCNAPAPGVLSHKTLSTRCQYQHENEIRSLKRENDQLKNQVNKLKHYENLFHLKTKELEHLKKSFYQSEEIRRSLTKEMMYSKRNQKCIIYIYVYIYKQISYPFYALFEIIFEIIIYLNDS